MPMKGVDPLRVAVERNLAVVPRSSLGEVPVEDATIMRWAFVGAAE